jgi:uncharacterized membrane protein YraQ (UPF0718 family)
VFFLAAVAVGLIGGTAAWWLESRGLLAGQARMSAMEPVVTDCCGTADPNPTYEDEGLSHGTRLLTIVETTPATAVLAPPAKLAQFAAALWANTRRLALYFLAFATLGYLVIRILPADLISEWLGTGNPIWSVPLAAVLGIPVYLNTEASLPLVASLMQGGMAPGAGLAFLITGAGTSIGAISGMLIIARWRIVALIIATLLATAITTGWLTGPWL